MTDANGFARYGEPTKEGRPETPDGNAAPPVYSVVAADQPPNGHAAELSPEQLEELNASFASLNLPSFVTTLSEDACLAHLKLLSAFEMLKEDVGYTDGLWGIYDSRAVAFSTEKSEKSEKSDAAAETRIVLAKLREKRWALYVARAVDRYTSWWNTFSHDPLVMEDMQRDSPKYSHFVKSDAVMAWDASQLPPLDVLMVWHAHMLNPRVYLEDCMRYGLRSFWTGGMPWKVVNEAIDTRFNYKVSEDGVKSWELLTGRKFDNTQDSTTKSLKCPGCEEPHEIPWTTCGQPEDSKSKPPGLVGEGYGDGNFGYICFRCHTVINGPFLEVAKIVADVKTLLSRNSPMPGTILDTKKGVPENTPAEQYKPEYQRGFPNRLIQNYLRSKILILTKPGRLPQATMEDVRIEIENAVKNQSALKHVEGIDGIAQMRTYRLPRSGRVPLRKMMSRYWNNYSQFSLELGGAVLRQGIFTEKMHKLDWIHSPVARDTMSRLIVKYERFVKIMAANPDQIVVPTLDVDLAWHTHQLSPRSYYDYTVARTQKFTDHDDKISEDKLTGSFEWTSKTYQEMFGEVYSSCTCWYCETVRAAHVSSVGKLLGVSKHEKIAEDFHKSGQANMCPPDSSAHISSHNAVKYVDDNDLRSKVLQRAHAAQMVRLDENYKKAQKRAEKKGRKIPPRDEYYHYYWGYPYMMYGPFAYPMYYTPGMYYGDPGAATVGSGTAGACAGGTCGGGTAAGACGGADAGGCGGSGGCAATAGCGGGCGAGGCGGGGGGGGCGGGGGGGGCGGGGS